MSYIGNIPLPQSTEARTSHTVTSGESPKTSFTVSYVPGYLDLFINGVLQDPATDYTATNGTSVTLTSGAVTGDIVSFIARTQTSALVALPLKDSSGAAILSESGSTVTLANVDTATIGSNALVVNSSGNVGIGTSNPSNKLTIQDGSNAKIRFNYSDGNEKAFCDFESSGFTFQLGTAGGDPIVLKTNNTERMRIDSSGSLILAGSTAQKASGTTWTNPSDIRLKENITNYSKGISELTQIQVKQWEYNGKAGTVFGQIGLGVIADEIESVLPNTVDTYSAKLNEDDETETDIKKFDATEITWLLVNTCKEQQTIIESQQSQIDALTARIEALETA